MRLRLRTFGIRTLLIVVAAAVLVVGLAPAAGAAMLDQDARTEPTVHAAPAGATTTEPTGGDGAGTSATGSVTRTPPVLIATSGFTFEDLDPRTTPNLWALMRNSSIGTITPRSVRASSCEVDGWLAVGSGRRAADEPREQCRAPLPPLDGWVADWDVYAQVARGDNYDASLGALSETVPAIAAWGPGAAIAAADPAGHLEHWSPVGEDLGSEVATASHDGRLVLVDLGNSAANGYSLGDLDRRVGTILRATGWLDEFGSPTSAGTIPVIFSSIADGVVGDSSMQATMMAVPGQRAGLLTSSSTRQPGLIQVPDLAPTLVALSGGTEMGNVAGAPMTVLAGGSWESRYQSVLDRQVAVKTQQDLSTWFFPVVAVLILGLLAFGWFLRKNHHGLVYSASCRLGIVLAAMPVSTYLVNTVPWERATNPDIAMIGALVGWSLVLGIIALMGPWRTVTLGPVLFVSVVTVVVLAYDVITGSQLQMSTLLGEPLLIASRFYGIGNSALALYCCALLLCVAGFASFARRPLMRVLIVSIPVLLSCIILAAPGLGTKFGSVPTLIIGVAYLVLAAAGIRFSLKRLALTVGIAGFVMLAVLFLDWLRPPDQRTHFGRFFDSILSGQALAVLARKIGMNIDILTQSWMTLVLPLIIVGVFWLALSPQRFGLHGLPSAYDRVPLLREAMISLAILLGVGTVINDSGIVVPAVGILFLVPVIAHLETFRAEGLPARGAGADAEGVPARGARGGADAGARGTRGGASGGAGADAGAGASPAT